jgi:hypothetical protein
MTTRECGVADEVASALEHAGIPYRREVRLGPRMRIDGIAFEDVGVEIKAGKPNATKLGAQLRRYAESGRIKAIVVIVQRNTFTVPDVGIPTRYVSLSALHGVAT